MNISPLISIIIPVYNVEKYIEKCIHSIINQTYNNFEAIIVNDGTPDNSIKLAKNIVKNDSRFIFLDKENGGLSSARNFGLHFSKGEFITFIDSDDYFESSFLEKMIGYINDDIDIISCNINNVTESGNIISKFTSPLQGLYSSTNIFNSAIESIKISCVAWGKLYRKTLFTTNNISYKEGILYEDFPTTYKLYYYSNNVYFIKDILINYVQRPLSITKNFDSKVITDSLWAINDLKNFLLSKNIFDLYKRQYNNAYLIHYVYRITKQYLSHSLRVEELESFLNNCDKKYFSYSSIIKLLTTSKKIAIFLLITKLNPNILTLILKIKK